MESKEKALLDYARKILADNGCDCYTYGECDPEWCIRDLKTTYPEGMDYPYLEVANAILSISRPRPIVREPYRVVWDSGTTHSSDAFMEDSLWRAQSGCLYILRDWMETMRNEWPDGGTVSPEQIEAWNRMIEEDTVWVEKYHPGTDTYKMYWAPAEDDLRTIGWVPYFEQKGCI